METEISSFFNLSTIIRQRRNSIDAIKEDPGRWILNKKKKREIREHLVENFNWANCY
jgi:hypothetical protein